MKYKVYININIEFNIFRILKHIMITKEWRQLFLHGTPGLFACLAKFQYKFKSKLPLLFKHLINLGIVFIILI